MSITRRKFIQGAAASAALIPLVVRAEQAAPDPALRLFRHGVASGDPLTDRVILWTRVTPPPTRSATGPIDVQWADRVGREAAAGRRPRHGAGGDASATSPSRWTPGVSQPGRTYYYAFTAGGERSPIGRTKTLPERADRLRVRLGVLLELPRRLLQRLSLSREPCRSRRGDSPRRLHLRVRQRALRRRLGVRPRAAAGRRSRRRSRTTATATRPIAATSTCRTRIACIRSSSSGTITSRPTMPGPAAPGITTQSKGDWAHASGRGISRVSRVDADPRIERHRRSICIARSASATWPIWSCSTRVVCATQQALGTDAKTLADPTRSLLGAAQEAWLFDQLRSVAASGIAVAPPRPADPVHAALASRVPGARTPMCGTATHRRGIASSTCSPARRSPTSRFSPATSTARGRWTCRGIRGPATTPRPAPGRSRSSS